MVKFRLLALLPLFVCGCTQSYLQGGLGGLQDFKTLEVSVENVNSAPFKILEFKSSLVYRSSGVASWRNWVKIQNKSNKKIIRYDIIFILYNVYGEKVTSFNGHSTSPLKGSKTTTGMWTDKFVMKDGDKAIARVSRLAFENGTFWEAQSN